MKKILCGLLVATTILTSGSIADKLLQIQASVDTVASKVEEVKLQKEQAEKLAEVETQEMRGVWVATVRNIDYPSIEGTTSSAELKAQADTIISTCAALGINNIFFQVRPTCDAYYKSNIFPWSRYLTGAQGVAPDSDFDPLAYWIKQAHANGIKIHAWVNPYRVTRDNDAVDTEWNTMIAASNPAKQHPEWVVRHNDNYYLNPGIPEVQQLVREGIMEIVNNYDIDGIHFDDYFYPNENSGPFQDDVTYATYGAGFASKADWRRNNVDTLVQSINPMIKAVKPNVVFGISPSGIWANKKDVSLGSNTDGQGSYTALYADTRKWAIENWVDYIAPQLYWTIGYDKANYKTLVNWWADQCRYSDTKLYIGMGDYRTQTTDATSDWYGGKGIAMIRKEMELNDTIDVIEGEIHYTYNTLAGSTSLQELYKELYQ